MVASVDVLVGADEFANGMELHKLDELDVSDVLGALDVPTRITGSAGGLGAADVPSGHPTSYFDIVAAALRRTDSTMKASNAHTRARQRISHGVASCRIVFEWTTFRNPPNVIKTVH